MNSGRTWILYSLIRLGVFAVVLALLLFLQIVPWVAAILAAIIALCISIIFLRRPREEASKTLYDARANRSARSAAPARVSEDESVEDRAVDDQPETSGSDAHPADEPVVEDQPDTK